MHDYRKKSLKTILYSFVLFDPQKIVISLISLQTWVISKDQLFYPCIMSPSYWRFIASLLFSQVAFQRLLQKPTAQIHQMKIWGTSRLFGRKIGSIYIP